ncbi:NADH-quinone oxidoreductase, chain G [Thioalkalivibrio sulfidiphilus HL-EbGr7]|uniref:NADH-quinone oxidoreductase n=1 Tax=Thioalkalivibrio sulfidiphilus (strain HL-EbGR7) TaxID=396588 RepID=B8GNZ1_THISH|nr:NADH-quinone oxidoreductase subunit NuoG [Thioalkalivibrio sulfidiphilus]ACL72080.1 NADH-quinone oxidoreductase, chain G [Thioalkalivibrio sulfidiphilus HL-EbGr7]
MSQDLVNIEINGIPLQARKGAMLIEVADEAGIKIPRFCYHKKLSVAANCRMCLVEVEKAPKPLPACATPVMDGMKAFTQSPKALAAQKGTMEFLLINHPLDCPICDQGGECELQDVAMGYGEDVSRYSEAKRVVKDKDIGPLIATEMTRCIHCTRCVRFGEEIAGIRELGATGRGEFMQIGTYIEKSVSSEMSGNVIDLCPVGALTAKPSRYTARPWELVQHATVAPHDSIGSNLFLHTREGRVMRAVPRDNEAVNETWISDRDRFSYTGLYADDRLTTPMVKDNGKWVATDWETALARTVEGLKGTAASEIGALLSPHASLEELYLAQKLLRGLGVSAIDHRLRQGDFAHGDADPVFPYLGLPVADLENLNAALLVASNVRKEQPIAAHRLRKAGLKGARLMAINTRDYGFAFPVTAQCITDPHGMVGVLAGVAGAALKAAGAKAPASLAKIIDAAEIDETTRAMAEQLKAGEQAVVLLGSQAFAHPRFSLLRALAAVVAEHTGAALGYLPEAANSAGAWLAGAVPHRGPAGERLVSSGLDAQAMLDKPRQAYVLLGVEPDLDCADGVRAREAIEGANFVVSLNAFASEATRNLADVLLPIATFAETSGTFVNAEGRWQSFQGVARPLGEARPGWKVLRVLGNMAGLNGFEHVSSENVRDELKGLFGADLSFDTGVSLEGAAFEAATVPTGLQRAGGVAIYALDPLVRRARPLQETADGRQAGAYISEAQARALDLLNTDRVLVRQNGRTATLDLVIDDGVAMGCVWIPAGMPETAALGAAFGPVELQKL